MKNFLITIFIITLVLGTSFGLKYLGIVQWGFFSAMKQDVERDVFENTQSYVEGKRQELTKYRLEYITTKDEDVKEAIKMTVIQSFANFDKSKLSYELRTFLESLTY